MKTYNYQYTDGSLNDIIDFSLYETHKNVLIQVFVGKTEKLLKRLLIPSYITFLKLSVLEQQLMERFVKEW